jgi:hypothetical protein
MINFFRKTRKKMADDNKPMKYMRYAIGEILLVVIGILIALSINNWNEERKLHQVELSLLKELKADLEFSKKELEIISLYNKKFVKEYRLINSFIEKDRAYDRVLDTAFAHLDIWSQPYLSTMTFETLKIRGIDIIKNDSLKHHIINVYNFHIKSLIEDMGQWEWSYNQNTTQRMMVGNIRRDIDNLDIARPNDFKRLKEDEEFRNFLNILIAIRSDHVDMALRTKSAVEMLIKHINKELQLR